MSILASRLKMLREKNGWTKTYVAEKLGIKTLSTYANYEYALREPDNNTLKRIAELYEVSLDFLLGVDSVEGNKQNSETASKNTELTPYQQEVIDFFNSREDLFFHDHPGDIRDALEQFEIYYEVWKKQQSKKKD